MTVIPKSDPRAIAAVEEMNELLGFDMRTVFSSDSWKIGIVDGKAEVLLDRAGVRTLAMFAPRPDAGQFVEDMFDAVDEHYRRQAGESR